MKMIMLGDVHGPLTEEQKSLFSEASKNPPVILRGDMMETGGVVNKDILKHIPVRVITLEDILNPARLGFYCPHDFGPITLKNKK